MVSGAQYLILQPKSWLFGLMKSILSPNNKNIKLLTCNQVLSLKHTKKWKLS